MATEYIEGLWFTESTECTVFKQFFFWVGWVNYKFIYYIQCYIKNYAAAITGADP